MTILRRPLLPRWYFFTQGIMPAPGHYVKRRRHCWTVLAEQSQYYYVTNSLLNSFPPQMKKRSHHKLWNENFRWLPHQILTFWWESFRICLPWVAVWCVLSGGTWRQANWVVRGRTQVSSASLSIATTVHSSDKPEDYHTLQYTTRCRTVLYLHYPTLVYSLI